MSELLTSDKIMSDMIGRLNPDAYKFLTPDFPIRQFGIQATMGQHIIGQWLQNPDGTCRYESYGKKKPRYLKICIRPPGMTYEERFGSSLER